MKAWNVSDLRSSLRKARSTQLQTCSCGLRSGEYFGQSGITSKPCSAKAAFASLVCNRGSLSKRIRMRALSGNEARKNGPTFVRTKPRELCSVPRAWAHDEQHATVARRETKNLTFLHGFVLLASEHPALLGFQELCLQLCDAGCIPTRNFLRGICPPVAHFPGIKSTPGQLDIFTDTALPCGNLSF